MRACGKEIVDVDWLFICCRRSVALAGSAAATGQKGQREIKTKSFFLYDSQRDWPAGAVVKCCCTDPANGKARPKNAADHSKKHVRRALKPEISMYGCAQRPSSVWNMNKIIKERFNVKVFFLNIFALSLVKMPPRAITTTITWESKKSSNNQVLISEIWKMHVEAKNMLKWGCVIVHCVFLMF